ncbi:beta/gamma crystallin-related protein [Nostoc flagelliforme]|uniref:beta/gamma crystallin-related protein n=1 Tax=Nostoc flagelliforme TaxID=1306274 RepID=UPI000C2D4A44|nr:beta/gamma crystallin-related protein [Nostoc flagelliforme]
MNQKSLANFSCDAVKDISDELGATYSGGLAYTGGGDPDVFLFQDNGFAGRALSVNATTGDGLGDLRTYGFNDLTSSISIIRGRWTFYRDINFNGPLTTLGRGQYSTPRSAGIPNDTVSSLLRVAP